jgi:hypothetical protein
MRVLAVITEPGKVRKILRHLVKITPLTAAVRPSLVELLICPPARSGEYSVPAAVPPPGRGISHEHARGPGATVERRRAGSRTHSTGYDAA